MLDYDRGDDLSLAHDLGVAAHPAFAVIAPDSDDVAERRFGPVTVDALREWLNAIAAQHRG
ncbi:MAG: hypothetical protein WEB13_10975 [Dehalococcoidia bacterium]